MKTMSSTRFSFRLAIIAVVGIIMYIFFPHDNSFRDGTTTRHVDSTAPEYYPFFNTSLYPPLAILTESYPIHKPLLKILEQWNPDNPTVPNDFTETLQHFNFSNPYERVLAEEYRKAEVPFKVYDVPIFNNVSKLWTKKYLSRNFKNMNYHVEASKTNHFMYWTTTHKRLGTSYKSPTHIVSKDYSFDSWSDKAEMADKFELDHASDHLYFMTGSKRNANTQNFVYRDLPVFRSDQPNFFIPSPQYSKGIQCRFGMRGVIAETHYDSGRNSVAMIKGNKRYILSPPESCKHLAIIADKKHPSFRHSTIDFSDTKQLKSLKLNEVRSIETILRTGEVLYIPSFWFHYIVSLDYSIQCNSRSGFPKGMNGKKEIEKCMKIKIRG